MPSLQWRHNERDDVSNNCRLDCLLNRLFRRRSKKTPKFYVIVLCEGNSPVTWIPHTNKASNPAIVSIWWRHHDKHLGFCYYTKQRTITESGSLLWLSIVYIPSHKTVMGSVTQVSWKSALVPMSYCVARRGSGVFVDWFDSTAHARSRSTTYSDQSTSVPHLIHVSSTTDPRQFHDPANPVATRRRPV